MACEAGTVQLVLPRRDGRTRAGRWVSQGWTGAALIFAATHTTDSGPFGDPPWPNPKTHVYSDAEIAARIQELGLAGWYLEEGWLRRKYNTDGWPQTLMAVNAIGYLCEAAYHHADLAVTWGKLWVKLKTHSAGGITDKDFEVAKKIEEVVLWRPAGGPLGTGNPHKFVFSKS